MNDLPAIARGALRIALAMVLFAAAACSRKDREVVVYCAQDQAYAEPLLREFAQQSGVRVRPLYDSEAVKTVGLANKLLAEQNHPQCDVFWGNEEMRTRQLAARGVFRPANGWAAVGYRSRRIVVNTNLLPVASAPPSLLALTNAEWRGKVALAYPQFGTTATHFHALRQLWGKDIWRNWIRALAANKPFLVEGNSSVVKLVGRGAAPIGLTDSDDIKVGQEQGMPIAAVPPGPETLLIPNTVGVVRNGPNPEPAQGLLEFLISQTTAMRLVESGALEGASAQSGPAPHLSVDWEALLRDLDETTAELNAVFLR